MEIFWLKIQSSVRENVQILKYFAQKDLQMGSFRTMGSWLEFEMYFIKTLSTIVCFSGEPRDSMVKAEKPQNFSFLLMPF